MSRHHDAVNTWLPDPSHYPEQMTPLSATVWFEAMGQGLHAAARDLRAPFGGFETRTELGWAYERELAPAWDPDPDVLRDAALALPERWQDELLPRVHAITRELEQMRPELPQPDEAVAMLDRLWEHVREHWFIHFCTVIPAQIAAELLHDEYVARFPGEEELAPYRFLEGVNNPADEAVAELAMRARELGVEDLLTEFTPGHALARLRETAPGREWLRALDGYLLHFGGRARWHELSLPREIEFPTLTLDSVRLLLDAPTRPERPELPQPPAELAPLVERVRASYALKELHTYEIDYPGLLATRDALLGYGRRLYAEGALAAVDDVWLLERAELRAAIAGENDLTHEIVEARRQELARGLAEGPHPFLGDPPAGVDRHAALDKFYGAGGSTHSGELHGTAASPGEAIGVARVVVDTGDFSRVQPGDVLVATTTTPAWTPLFPSLGGLVTETGGILSHAAVVAREYRLPAVVGVVGATRAIADGARIRIDGSTGQVELV
jgi:phosphohistidine swiveling domain-containing protein